MPKTRKKKKPITSSAILCASSTPDHTRNVIRRFHALLKRKAQLQRRGVPQDFEDLRRIEREIEELGGLRTYQQMSSIGQGRDRGGGTEKVLIQWLRQLGMDKRRINNPLRLLEVGALNPDNYGRCSPWIHCTPIDLCSRHPAILEQDFFLMDEAKHQGKWDIISLSLVLNFVSDAQDRGQMLRMAHVMLSAGGYLFLALPLPCVLNSRYLTFDLLKELMEFIGFEEMKNRWRTTGKMAHWLYRKLDSKPGDVDSFKKKSVLRQGDRNNFTILLR